MKLKLIFSIVVFSFTFLQIDAQVKRIKKSKPKCAVKGFLFDCPEDFVKEDTISSESIIFKGDSDNLVTYLFISTSIGFADKDKVVKKIAENFGSTESKKLQLKDITEPLLMDLDSKYKKSENSFFGFDGKILLNFVNRQFSYKGKKIYIGYAYKLDDTDAKAEFENPSSGENAVGCNAVASLINSITKEKKDKEQYCTLTAFTGSALN
jgi:hypothetical protein